jgi:hypothetical protein
VPVGFEVLRVSLLEVARQTGFSLRLLFQLRNLRPWIESQSDLCRADAIPFPHPLFAPTRLQKVYLLQAHSYTGCPQKYALVFAHRVVNRVPKTRVAASWISTP